MIHRYVRMLHLFSKVKVYLAQEAKEVMGRTTSTVERVAAITLGPYGRNILIQNEMQEPRITKDGITVVKHIEFENRLEDAIASLIKKSVDGTNKYAGDGTTTSTVLIGQIMREAIRQISLGESSREIRKGLEIGRKIGIQFVQSCCRKISGRDELMQVAMISTNGKENIASLISDAVTRSDSVTIEKSQRAENSVEFYSGIKVARGFESTEFVNTGKGKVVYNYPLVVVSESALKNVKEVVRCLEMAKQARKQLIFFAPDFSDAVKSTLIYNSKKKIVETACISVPAFGDVGREMLPRIASMTQSYYFSQFSDRKIEDADWQDFGKAVKIQADQYQSQIQVKQNHNKDNVSAVIYVGGPNQTAMLQNYDHIVDSLNSVMTAKKDGVVAGGGVTLWRLSELLDGYQGEGKAGVKILAKALKQPRSLLMQHICQTKKPLSGDNWEGYDLKSQKIVDMFEAGIVDSANVAKSTLIDSISLCCVLVEVEIGIARADKNLSTVSLKDLNKKYSL